MSKKLKSLAVVMGIVGALTLVSVPAQSVSASTKALDVIDPAIGGFVVTTQREGHNFNVLVKGPAGHKVLVTAEYSNSKGEKIDTVERKGITNRSNKYTTLVEPSNKTVEKEWTLVRITVRIDGKINKRFAHTR